MDLAMVLTAATIAAATGGHLTSGTPEREIGGFSIDSRTLRPGDLFFAIVAARDGHEFVRDALANGAVGAVVNAGVDLGLAATATDAVESPVLIEVADTTSALQDLARAVRRQSAATVVAITGSAGKTTTKDTIAALVSGRHRLVKNRGNLNNHLGLPLSLLELRHGANVAVMELGMNHAGELSVLVRIAEPQIRVWTNVGDAHLGHFASREAVADAKAEILEQASKADVLVCNADDPLIMERTPVFAGRISTFGTAPQADVRADSIDDLGLAGTQFRLSTSSGTADIHLPLVGRGNLANLLAAVAVALELDVPLSEIVERASRLRPSHHRGSVLELQLGVVVLDDSYNSSPAALKQALAVIADDVRGGRKAAVLGEMLELGAHSIRLHQECGIAAAAAGLERLIVVGGEPARMLGEAAIGAGMSEDAVTWTASSGAASDLILSWLRAGDLVLVKGSRGLHTDTVVERIREAYS